MAEFSFTYRAFISYAHADHDWGVWVHRALERYRVPKRLAGAEGLRRLGKLFRDEEELGAAAELGPKIDAALRSSDVLVVVCSPRSVKSKWVNQEIEAFKKLGREHRVFALIVDGQPHSAEQECFPDALKLTVAGGMAEPLAVDVRKFGREDAALRLIAGMLEVGYDDLRQREVRRRRAEMVRAQALFAGGLALTIAALTGGYFAAANYVDASEKKSALLAREADALFDEGLHAKAMLMALYGDPAAQAGWAERALRPGGFPSAQAALTRAYTHNRLAAVFDGHDDEVTVVAFSPDGGTAATGSRDGKVKLWNVATGETSATFAHNDWVHDVAFSPDGKMIAVGWGLSTTLWPVGGGEAAARIEGAGGGIFDVAFSPDGKTLLITSGTGMVQLWPVSGGLPPLTFAAYDSHVMSSAFSPDGKTFVTVGGLGVVTLWPAIGGPALATFKAPRDTISAVAFSPDGKKLLMGHDNGMATLVPPAGGPAIETIGGHREYITSVAFSPNGRKVLTSSWDGQAKLWRLDTMAFGGATEVVATFAGHDGKITSAVFSPDGNSVLTGGADGTARLWRIIDSGRTPTTFSDDGAMMLGASFSPDGESVLVATTNQAKLWPASGGEPSASFGGGRGFGVAAFSPDGKTVATGSSGGEMNLWPIDGGPPTATFKNGRPIQAITYTPDGKNVLTNDQDGVVKLWPAAGGDPVEIFGSEKRRQSNVAISPDGAHLLTGFPPTLWPISGGEPLATFEGGGSVFAFSPDGKTIATAADEVGPKLWPASGGAALATYAGSGASVRSLAFSPDGKFLAGGFNDRTAKLWKTTGGKPLETFFGHDDDVASVAFSPDSKHVLTAGGDDRTAKLWTIDPMIFAVPKDQVRMACEKLKEIGVTKFSDADYVRFPILDRNAPHPCAKVWGFDPRVKREAEAAGK